VALDHGEYSFNTIELRTVRDIEDGEDTQGLHSLHRVLGEVDLEVV